MPNFVTETDPGLRIFKIVHHFMKPFRPQMEFVVEGGVNLVERWDFHMEAFPERVFHYYPRRNMLEHSSGFLVDDFAVKAGKFFSKLPASPVDDNVVLGEN